MKNFARLFIWMSAESIAPAKRANWNAKFVLLQRAEKAA
jgi:hypothetical protein